MNLTPDRELAENEWHLHVRLPPYEIHNIKLRFFRLEPDAPYHLFRIHVVDGYDATTNHQALSWLIRMLDRREGANLTEMAWKEWAVNRGGHVVELPRMTWYPLVKSLARNMVELGFATAYPAVPG